MNTNYLLDKYLEEYFPNLELASPLFYNTDIGIRFEVGNPNPSSTDKEYNEQVHYRSTKLFKETHHGDDDIFIVCFLDLNRKKHTNKTKMKVFKHSLNNTKVLRSLSCKNLHTYDEENEGWESYRYVLQCKVSDIKVLKFLFANNVIYFFNTSRHTIFHFYDSRGLDIVGNSRGILKELYITYNHWILNYDRDRIDLTFAREEQRK